jgi:hypothetical protein
MVPALNAPVLLHLAVHGDGDKLVALGILKLDDLMAAPGKRVAAATLALLPASAVLAQQPGRLLVVDVHGKYGFINPNGRFVIQLLFDFAWGFSGGLAPARVGKGAA